MNNVMGVINLIHELDHMEELTYNRCLASVPFGARYRLIDFIMSSMVNSGIGNVSVFAHTKFRSLMDHLGSGKEWDLDRKRNGLFFLPPAVEDLKEMYRGDLYHFYNHRDYFRRSTQDYVLISRSHMVCNVDFQDVLRTHLGTGADVTVVYKKMEEHDAKVRRLQLNGEGRVVDMQDHNGRLQEDNVSMEMFLLHKDLLTDMVETFLAQGYDHFVRDAIMKNIGKLNIRGYEYNGHLGVVNTVQSYFANSMKLLNPSVYKDLFFRPGLIYTKIKDEAPTKYMTGSEVQNSLIANGCVIEGKVENCILSRGVKIDKGTHLRNCIVLQNTRVGENVKLVNAVLDKDVQISDGKVLLGDPSAPFIAVKKKHI